MIGGLPVLVAAAARLLQAKNWRVNNDTLESFFRGQFASGERTDAHAMIESTIPDDEARELLYRLTCVVGPISKTQIEQISKIPEKIRLAADKLDQLLGLWVQPYAKETFLLSPLVEPSLSGRLDSETRRGVHAILAMHLLKRKTKTVLDLITCIHHFQLAELLHEAATVLTKTLLSLTQMDREVPDEYLLLRFWTVGPLPSALDINVRLLLRALQIGLADKQGAEFSHLLDDLDRLMVEAQPIAGAQFGLLAAGGSISIRFARKYPSIANRYLLAMLRSARGHCCQTGRCPSKAIPCLSNRFSGQLRTQLRRTRMSGVGSRRSANSRGTRSPNLAHPTLRPIARWFFATRSGSANSGNRSHNRNGRHAMRYCSKSKRRHRKPASTCSMLRPPAVA